MGRAGARRRAARAMIVVAAGLGLGSCAYVTAVPVKPNSKVHGIRVYDVKPLLVVSGTGTEVIMVPNYNRGYALQFGAFLARNNFSAAIKDGMLTNVAADLDPSEFVKLLGTLASKLPSPGKSLSGQGEQASGGVQDRYQVYDIVFDDDGNLVALKPLIFTHDLLTLKTSGAAGGGAKPKVVPQPDEDEGGVNTGPLDD